MSNSSIIGKAKNKIIKKFIQDKDIINAIDSSIISKDTPEKLIYTHIFDYNQNPHTLNNVGTFITIEIHISESYYNKSKVFINPTIEIWIISHEKHMKVNNIPKITENRNDYLSELIDKKLNGKSDFGIGKLSLKSNTGGAFQMDYLYRKMIFECLDINDSLCGDE